MKSTISTSGESRAGRSAGLIVTAFWCITFIGARFVLSKDETFPQWAKVTAALIPIVPTAMFLWYVVSAIRGMDELCRRVHLEALAIAYPLAILLLVTLGFLQLAIDLPAEDWSYRHIWIYLPCFYFVGLSITWRRYR